MDAIPTAELAVYEFVKNGRFGKKAAGRLLDGVLHDEYPKP